MVRCKAPLAIAIIARDAERTIGACLDSIVPHVEQVVVCVDHRTRDGTAALARRHGAEVRTRFRVSRWHACPAHGRVRAQHFAEARQRSFALLRRDVPFHGWLDADDVVEGGERLVGLLRGLDPEVAGLWLPYHYSRVGGQTATLFDRERIVRHAVGWQWQHRVHEILTPVGRPTESLQWSRTDDVRIVHQGEGHDTAGSARRNILLLEIELEQDPEDARSLFYLGNQYFALGEWETAAFWYERATGATNAYQLWQTWLYLSMTYEKLGDISGAKSAAYQAMDAAPYHPEPFYRLAAVDGLLRGDVKRCAFWTRLGDQMPEAPFFAFKNPLDRTFNARVTLGNAYANAGEVSRARRELERAHAVVQTPELERGIAEMRALEEDARTADAWARVLEEETAAREAAAIPARVWRFGRVRDVLVPTLLRGRDTTRPRIVFWCGRSLEPWAPPSLNDGGIGGSETAVIEIARRFARDGWRVDVYNDCDRLEGEYESVGYWDCRRLEPGERTDVLVSWRDACASDLSLERRAALLWCHDLHSGPRAGDALARWDRVLGVSMWHTEYLARLYPGTRGIDWVPNGVDLERFAMPTRRVPFRCVYASSPDRGLATLLRMWPEIVAAEPAAELHVAYGWETIDRSVQGGHAALAGLKAEILGLLERTPRVVWRGRLPQDALARLYQESVCWLYPTSFLETFCISAVEAMAGGCVPVTSAAGALPETIGDAGVLVSGNAYGDAWRQFFVSCAKAALLTPEVRRPLAARGPERARALTWDRAYERWAEIVTPLVEERRKREGVLA